MRLGNRFNEALVYAAELHREQFRKGTTIPYLSHLLAVTAIVMEQGADEEEAIAALLHDAIEDQGGAKTQEQIRRRFGDRVAGIVRECSDTDVFPKPPWKERKEAYVARISRISPSARLISLADKLHNARSTLADYRQVGDSVWNRFKGGRDGTLWYYRTLVGEYQRSGASRTLVDELDRIVRELEQATG